MFTGLIQKIGEVKSINSHHGDIQAILSADRILFLRLMKVIAYQ